MSGLQHPMVWWVCRFDINQGQWTSPHTHSLHQWTLVGEALIIIPGGTAMALLLSSPIWAPCIHPACWHHTFPLNLLASANLLPVNGQSPNAAPLTSACEADVKSRPALAPHSPGSARRVISHLHRRLNNLRFGFQHFETAFKLFLPGNHAWPRKEIRQTGAGSWSVTMASAFFLRCGRVDFAYFLK